MCDVEKAAATRLKGFRKACSGLGLKEREKENAEGVCTVAVVLWSASGCSTGVHARG